MNDEPDLIWASPAEFGAPLTLGAQGKLSMLHSGISIGKPSQCNFDSAGPEWAYILQASFIQINFFEFSTGWIQPYILKHDLRTSYGAPLNLLECCLHRGRTDSDVFINSLTFFISLINNSTANCNIHVLVIIIVNCFLNGGILLEVL